MSQQQNNLSDLNDKNSYNKKILSDENKKVDLLIKHIQQICYDMGYILTEIKICKND